MQDQDRPALELREKHLGELFKQLSSDLSTLVRQELALAQTEMTQKGKQAGLGIGMFGGAGLLALLALGSLSAFFIALLATALKTWLAALIVAVAYGVLAGALALSGKSELSSATPPVPDQTIETVKEDVQWAKTQLR
jgi:uncharacterized membrane protein YqjE